MVVTTVISRTIQAMEGHAFRGVLDAGNIANMK
jgi:hypothetical protein